MVAEQISFISSFDEKRVQELVIQELKSYRAMRVYIENKKEQEQEGVFNLFPSLRRSQKENEIKVRQIERALNHSLDATERKIIEEKYLNSVQVNDINIYLDLGLKKGKYYEKKRAAIHLIATALGII